MPTPRKSEWTSNFNEELENEKNIKYDYLSKWHLITNMTIYGLTKKSLAQN
jgi:hypothetical protein